jgi:threonine/homoserine/homoserine lactone efflux protein
MPTLTTLVLFALAALVLLLIPGPAVLYITLRGAQQGRRAGVLSALGVGVGNLCQVLAAAAGLSAILLTSALAFAAVKFVGAAYLIWLGLRTLLARDEPAAETPEIAPSGRIFAQGFFVSLFNPKTALFFLAFFPQFVDPSRGSVVLQTLLLGSVFVTMGIGTDSLYGIAAARAAKALRSSPRLARRQRLVTGSLYLALGVATATSGHGQASHR